MFSFHNIIKTKIKKLNFISKILDNYRFNINTIYNSDDDTDKDDSDFSSYLFDTKNKCQIIIIEIFENLLNPNLFKSFSYNISYKLNSLNLDNPEFILYKNYLIHLRFININNKFYIILLINNNLDYYQLRLQSSNIIKHFSNFSKFHFNLLLFKIDFDLFSKNKIINSLFKFGKTNNNIFLNNLFLNENYYSYNDGLFNYFIQINNSNNSIRYYYYRIDKYIFNPHNL